MRGASPSGADRCRLDVLRQYPKAAVMQFLLKELRERNCDNVTDRKLQSIYDGILCGSGGITVSGAVSVRIERELLLFLFEEKREDPLREIPFAPPQSFRINGKQAEIQVLPA